MKKFTSKIGMLNIPCLLGFFIENESRINRIYKDAAKSIINDEIQ